VPTTIPGRGDCGLDDHVETAFVVDARKLRGLVTARDVAATMRTRDVGSMLVIDVARWNPLVVRQQDALAERASACAPPTPSLRW
jgi:hypothetical protein